MGGRSFQGPNLELHRDREEGSSSPEAGRQAWGVRPGSRKQALASGKRPVSSEPRGGTNSHASAPVVRLELQENQGGVIAARLQSAGRASLGRGRVLWGPPPPSASFPRGSCHPSPTRPHPTVPWCSPLRDPALCSQVHYPQRPVALWCGLNHSLVLSQGSDFSKELLGCGCGAGGRLPGWPKGSASFVKLHIKVRAGSGERAAREGQSSRAHRTVAGAPTGTQGPRVPAPPTSLSCHVPWLLALSLSCPCWPAPTSHNPGAQPASSLAGSGLV